MRYFGTGFLKDLVSEGGEGHRPGLPFALKRRSCFAEVEAEVPRLRVARPRRRAAKSDPAITIEVDISVMHRRTTETWWCHKTWENRRTRTKYLRLSLLKSSLQAARIL